MSFHRRPGRRNFGAVLFDVLQVDADGSFLLVAKRGPYHDACLFADALKTRWPEEEFVVVDPQTAERKPIYDSRTMTIKFRHLKTS